MFYKSWRFNDNFKILCSRSLKSLQAIPAKCNNPGTTQWTDCQSYLIVLKNHHSLSLSLSRVWWELSFWQFFSAKVVLNTRISLIPFLKPREWGRNKKREKKVIEKREEKRLYYFAEDCNLTSLQKSFVLQFNTVRIICPALKQSEWWMIGRSCQSLLGKRKLLKKLRIFA